MAIFGRKKPTEADAPASGAAPDTAALPAGAAADNVDLASAAEPAAMAGASETTDAQDALKPSDGRHFYRQPEALSASKHATLGVTRGEHGFAFARSSHLVPITLEEFPQVALHYPIIFVGPQRIACAVLGLREGTNLFVGADGSFEDGAYAPAYLRQYPFLLARSKEQDKSVLFIDRASDYVVENGGSALFENGEPTDFTKGALSFLMNLQGQWARTQTFCKRMEEMGLMDVKDLKLAARDAQGGVGEAKPVIKYVAIDADRVAALTPEHLKTLAEEKVLAAIYAHHISLYNWGKIVSRAFAAQRAAA